LFIEASSPLGERRPRVVQRRAARRVTRPRDRQVPGWGPCSDRGVAAALQRGTAAFRAGWSPRAPETLDLPASPALHFAAAGEAPADARH